MGALAGGLSRRTRRPRRRHLLGAKTIAMEKRQRRSQGTSPASVGAQQETEKGKTGKTTYTCSWSIMIEVVWESPKPFGERTVRRGGGFEVESKRKPREKRASTRLEVGCEGPRIPDHRFWGAGGVAGAGQRGKRRRQTRTAYCYGRQEKAKEGGFKGSVASPGKEDQEGEDELTERETGLKRAIR